MNSCISENNYFNQIFEIMKKELEDAPLAMIFITI